MNSGYLIHYNHNHDSLGRFASTAGSAAASIGGKITGKSKKKKVPEADIKSGKAANTKLSDSERNRIVNSGSAKEVAKYKNRLSTKELETAVNRIQKEQVQRIDLEKKLSDLSSDNKKQKQSALEKIEKYSSDLERISNSVEKAAKMYNTAAKVHNAMSASNDQWPIYGEKKPEKTSQYIKDIMRTGTIDQIKANKGKMTSEQYKQAVDRVQADQRLENFRRNETGELSREQKIVRTSGSLEDVYRNRGQLTGNEYTEAVRRAMSDKALKDVIDGKMTYEEYDEKYGSGKKKK